MDKRSSFVGLSFSAQMDGGRLSIQYSRFSRDFDGDCLRFESNSRTDDVLDLQACSEPTALILDERMLESLRGDRH